MQSFRNDNVMNMPVSCSVFVVAHTLHDLYTLDPFTFIPGGVGAYVSLRTRYAMQLSLRYYLFLRNNICTSSNMCTGSGLSTNTFQRRLC